MLERKQTIPMHTYGLAQWIFSFFSNKDFIKKLLLYNYKMKIDIQLSEIGMIGNYVYDGQIKSDWKLRHTVFPVRVKCFLNRGTLFNSGNSVS